MASSLFSDSSAQAQYLISSSAQVLQSFWFDTLRGPAGAVWWNAIYQAVYDSQVALQSISSAAFMTAKPFCILLFLITRGLAIWIWNVIIVQGLYNHGLSQAQTLSMWIYRFHMDLTREELLGEIALIALMIGIYHFRKWLQRQTYVSRTIQWYRSKKSKIIRSVKTKYNRTVNQIAKVSLFLAIMTPHTLFAVGSLSTALIFPKAIRWLACESAFSSILNWWCPVIATLVLLGEIWEQKQQQLDDKKQVDASKENQMPALSETPNHTKTSKSSLTRTPKYSSTPKAHSGKSPIFPRTTPANSQRRHRSRSSLLEVSQRVLHIHHDEDFIGERQTYWFQYWIVYAFVEGSKRVLFKLPYVSRWFGVTIKILELFFYLWLHVMPYCLPQFEKTPEGRPLVVLSNAFGKYAAITYESLSNVVSATWWENRCVYFVKQVADAFALVRIISRDSAARSADWARLSRTLLVPAVTLFMPGFMTAYGVLYVQFALPVARASLREWDEQTELQYWILHALVSAALEYFAGLLWWIPFSNHMVFFLFVWLSFQANVNEYFGYFQHDLQLLGIFPATEADTDKETRIGRLLKWILSLLPRAQDENDPEKPPKADDSNKDQGEKSGADSINNNQSTNSDHADMRDNSPSPTTPVANHQREEDKEPSTPDSDDSDAMHANKSEVPRVATRRSTRLKSKS